MLQATPSSLLLSHLDLPKAAGLTPKAPTQPPPPHLTASTPERVTALFDTTDDGTELLPQNDSEIQHVEEAEENRSPTAPGKLRLSSRFKEQVAALEKTLNANFLKAKKEMVEGPEQAPEGVQEGPEQGGSIPWMKAYISELEAQVANASDDIWEVDPDTNVVEGNMNWDAGAETAFDFEDAEVVDTEEEESSDEGEAIPPIEGCEEAPGTPQGNVNDHEGHISPPGTPECDDSPPAMPVQGNPLEPATASHYPMSPARIPVVSIGSSSGRQLKHITSSPMQIPLAQDTSDNAGGPADDADLSQVLDDLLAARSLFEAEGSFEAVAEIDRQVTVARAAGGKAAAARR